MLRGLMREFPGYTLSGLLGESTALLRLLAAVKAGDPGG